MEANPVIPSSVEDNTSNDKQETRRRKKKNVANLGTFIVETKPSAEKERAQAVKRAERYLRRLESRDLKPEPTKLEKADISSKLAKENDKTPELDGEAPLEHLSHVETIAVNQNLGKVRQEEIADELKDLDPNSREAEQSKIAQEFMDLVSETGDPELATQKLVEAYGLNPIEAVPSSEIIESEPVDFVESNSEPLSEIIDTHHLTEGEIDLNSSEHPITAPGNSDGSSGTGGRGRSGGRFSGPSGVPPAPGPLPSAAAPSGPGSTAKNPVDPNNISTEDLQYYEKKAVQRGLLVGGIVGYLIGRRRGRIKTEKKLLPVQKKLRKEVQSLESRLIDNEYALRRAVAQRDELSRREVRKKPAAEKAPIVPRIIQEKNKAPEAPKLPAQKVPLERIGHVIVAAEAEAKTTKLPAAKVERSASRQVVSTASAEKQATTMRRSDLMELSEKISVEGTSLRQIYETHLISERGLRRLVTEYLKGGSIQKALRRELIEREIDFERDPALRDRARSSVSGSGKGAVNSLVQESAAMVTTNKTTTKLPPAKLKAHDAAIHDNPKHSHLADISLVSIIAILLALVIFIALHGH